MCARAAAPTPRAVCVCAAPASVLEALLESWPDGAAQLIEATSCLPLHLAARHHAPARVVRILLSAFAAAAALGDADERLPLHLAAANRADVDVCAALLHAHPAAAATADVDEMLPLHHAVRRPAPSPRRHARLPCPVTWPRPHGPVGTPMGPSKFPRAIPRHASAPSIAPDGAT
jgi:hypothetical protein